MVCSVISCLLSSPKKYCYSFQRAVQASTAILSIILSISSSAIADLKAGEVCVYQNSRIGYHYCECNHPCDFQIAKDGGQYFIKANVYHTVGYNYTCEDGWPDDNLITNEACVAILPEILANLSPTHLSDPGSMLGCGNIHSYSAVFIAHPTPTPTIASVKDPLPPTVDAVGPYLNAACVAGNTSVQLNASAVSKVAKNPTLTLNWATNCPQATFSSNNTLNPILNFASVDAANKPTKCSVEIFATDSLQRTVSDTAEITVGACSIDCKGVVGGTAKVDKCGVCQGDGTSCPGCESRDISADQHQLDTSGAEQRNYVLQANKAIFDAKKNTLQKLALEKLNKRLATYSQTAHSLYVLNWEISYSNPNVVLQCLASSNCASLSNVASKNEYAVNSSKFTKILLKQKKLLNQNLDGKVIVKLNKLIAKSRAVEKSIATALEKIPDTRSSC